MYRTLCILGLALTSTIATAQVTFSKTAYGIGQAPNSPAVADFNRDGKPDFAVMEAGNQLTIFLNIGSGKFSQKAQYAVVTNDNGTNLDTADFNGDGIPDLIIGKQYAPEFELWYGNGDGTFRFGKDVSTYSPDAYGLQLADVNNDGKVDVVWVYNDDTSSIAWAYLNDGNANFNPVGGASLPSFVDNYAFGDFDRDGKTDLVARIGTTLYEYSGDGTGHFVPHKTSTVKDGIGNLAVGSFNHDGILDVAQVVTDCSNNSCDSSKRASVYVYLNDGTGHFGLRSSYSAGAGFGSITAGELNGDGVQDIIVMSNDLVTGNAVPAQYLLNQGDGHFNGPYSLGSFSQQTLPAVRDLNLDGRHDIVLPAGSSYVLLNQNAAVACAPPGSASLSARICGPASNATVARTFTVRGSGNSPLGVVRMELWVDGKKSNEVVSDQINKTITVSAARHRIAIVAVDRFGKSASTAIYVTAQ